MDKTDKAQRGAQQTINRLKLFNIKDEVIMDIGANVGHVSRWLADNGAAKVIGYEPHPLAFKQCIERCPDLEIVNAALLTDPGKMSLQMSAKDAGENYFCNGSLLRASSGVGVEVDIISFKGELDRIKPTAIKLDTEGSEYDMILNNDLPDTLKWISMEVHRLNAIGAPLFAALVRKMAKQGFGMSPLQPSSRPAPGILKTFWGFQQVDFSRECATKEVDAIWIESMIDVAQKVRKTTRVPTYQALFDQEFPR